MRRRDLLKSVVPVVATAHLLQGATFPRPALDIKIAMPNGKPPVQLSSYKGKVVLVEFLLTYCSHCQKASLASETVYQELKSKGFEVIGAAINPGADAAAYARDLNLTFPVGTIQQDFAVAFLEFTVMHRMQMPEVAFVNRNFEVVSQFEGNEQFFQQNEIANIRNEALKWLTPAAGKPAANSAKKKS
jgi:peroxiredoxin